MVPSSFFFQRQMGSQMTSPKLLGCSQLLAQVACGNTKAPGCLNHASSDPKHFKPLFPLSVARAVAGGLVDDEIKQSFELFLNRLVVEKEVGGEPVGLPCLAAFVLFKIRVSRFASLLIHGRCADDGS